MVRSKFQLDNDVPIELEDEEGAEIDSEVFPLFLGQSSIPNVVFQIRGEVSSQSEHIHSTCSQAVFYVNNSSPSSTSFSPIVVPSGDQEVDNYKQILVWHMEQNPELENLVSECNRNKFVEASTGSILIKEFVGKLVQIKGQVESPSTREQKLFAKAILELVPAWRYPGTVDGIDILYDEVNRSGLVQAKLRHIHKNLKSGSNNRVAPTRKRVDQDSGGPIPKSSKLLVQVVEEITSNFDSLIHDLNSTCPKTGLSEISRLMKETLPHRAQLRLISNPSLLKLYPKFTECDFLINHEFNLMFEDLSSKFLDIWPAFSTKLINHVKGLKVTPALEKFLATESGKWDDSIFALLALLQLIPLAPQGKGKGSRAKIEDARHRLVSFYKTSTPYSSILDTWTAEKTQPNLVCIGESSAVISSYFIVCDGVIIPINAKNSVEAVDTLFKTHYVLAAEYDKNLVGFWKFIQVYIYKLDVPNTHLPPDIMHDLLEGVVPYEVKIVLQKLITLGTFTLETINSRLLAHNFGYLESRNRPNPIKLDGTGDLIITDKEVKYWELLLQLLDSMRHQQFSYHVFNTRCSFDSLKADSILSIKLSEFLESFDIIEELRKYPKFTDCDLETEVFTTNQIWDFLPPLKFHLRPCHFLKCVNFEFSPSSGRLAKLKSVKLLRFPNFQSVLSVSYCLVLFLNLCLGPIGTRDKLQGAVFFLLILVATVARWNQGLHNNGAIQTINSFLHFEDWIFRDLSAHHDVPQSLVAKATKAFLWLIEISIPLVCLFHFVLLLIVPCTPPFILSMSASCSANAHNSLARVVIHLFESWMLTHTVYTADLFILFVFCCGIVSLLTYYKLMERKLQLSETIHSSIHLYRRVHLLEKCVNDFVQPRVLPGLIFCVPGIQIIAQYITINHHADIAMPGFLVFPILLLNAVISNMLLLTLASFVHKNSTKILHNLTSKWVHGRTKRGRATRRELKSLTPMKIKFGSILSIAKHHLLFKLSVLIKPCRSH
ncbi:hypothetical protein Fcan01_15418 [Folsomia candida]|uniref:Uncharacterized protein n=1 Tax=Folsomia candida TaxID=158441 RepID=A0A226DY54_FOLCA|nr:hypothetical protein Fcan01_15418 [Folsomia candida]